MTVTQGTWGNLPDLGITELFANSSNPTWYNPNRVTGLTDITGQYAIPTNNISLTPTSTLNVQPQVQGAATTQTTNQTQTKTEPVTQTTSGPSQEDFLRSGIGLKYDEYLSSLDRMLYQDLPYQKTTQEGIVNSQYDQGIASLDTQRLFGLADLGTEQQKVQTNQVKTLNDVASNIRNLMQSGNNYLGARGAGDSSAVSMYGRALTDMGTKQRGDVISQANDMFKTINDKRFKLNTLYEEQKVGLQTQTAQKLLEVQKWYADQVGNLNYLKDQGKINREIDMSNLSTNLVDSATAQIQQISRDMLAKRQQLDSWAQTNSNTLAALAKNLEAVRQYTAPAINYSPLQMQGDMVNGGQTVTAPYGYGTYSEDDLKRLFG